MKLNTMTGKRRTSIYPVGTVTFKNGVKTSDSVHSKVIKG